MKLYYEIETARHIDRHGEEVIDTDAVECEVDDFDVLCAYMKNFSPKDKMLLIYTWSNQTREWRNSIVEEIMRTHGAEIEDFFRQRALDCAFSSQITN